MYKLPKSMEKDLGRKFREVKCGKLPHFFNQLPFGGGNKLFCLANYNSFQALEISTARFQVAVR